MRAPRLLPRAPTVTSGVGPAGVGRGRDARRPTATPVDPAAGWERFAASRLDWDAEAVVPVDLLFVTYARWCGSRGAPVLAEDHVLAWLTAHGASVRTGTHSRLSMVVEVRVVA
jgi:hypothetical protein